MPKKRGSWWHETMLSFPSASGWELLAHYDAPLTEVELADGKWKLWSGRGADLTLRAIAPHHIAGNP